MTLKDALEEMPCGEDVRWKLLAFILRAMCEGIGMDMDREVGDLS